MTIVRFGDVVKEVKQNVDRENNPYKHYVAGDHMDSEDLTIHRFGNFDTDDVGPAFTRIFKPGQILYGSRRTYLKKIAVASFEGICANTTFVFESKDSEVLCQELLPFIMLSDDFTQWSVSHSKGSTNPYVLFSDLANFEFSLPPLSVQRELSKKLWAAYRLKESYKKLLMATRDMVKSQFIEMFGNHQRIATIRDFVDLEILNVKKKYSKGDKILYIDISSIDGNSNQVKSTKEYIVGKEPSRAQQCVQKGDILVSTVRPNKRNIAVIGIENKNLVASTGFCILRSKKGYQEYLLSVVKSDEYTNAMIEKAYGGVYPAVNNSDILSFAVPMPSEYELKRFRDIYIQADKSEFELKKSIEAIDAVIKSLINN